MTIYSYTDYLRNPFLATDCLGELLRKSALRLFLGAGASNGLGLPAWKMLVARAIDKDTDAAFVSELDGKSSSELGKLVSAIDDGSSTYVQKLHVALYRDIKPNLLEQLQVSPLLLALAALMTGMHRGRVSSVVTYNYDDLLEQYLKMLGLAVCCRTMPDELSTSADVEVNYVHGRLPQSWSITDALPEIVLSERSFRTRRAGIDKGWSAMVEHGLYSKIGLFIGLSGDDSSILDILKRAVPSIKRSNDYTGYWLLTPDAFLRNSSDIQDVGMCPIRIEKQKIPEFLFRICQSAAR